MKTVFTILGLVCLSLGISLSLGFGMYERHAEKKFQEKFLEPSVGFQIDLNGDKVKETGKIIFREDGRGQAYVWNGNGKETTVLFESKPEWDVREILAGDFDNDSANEMALSLWKEGNYGSSLPFWVKENDKSYKMHLFLYEWKDDRLAPMWQSSNLPKENLRVRLMDRDFDGRNELIVKEREYGGSEENFSMWQWNGWGFEKEISSLSDLPYF